MRNKGGVLRGEWSPWGADVWPEQLGSKQWAGALNTVPRGLDLILCLAYLQRVVVVKAIDLAGATS